MNLRDHSPKDKLGNFILGGDSYLGGRSRLFVLEEQSIATGDADVVLFVTDTRKLNATEAGQWRRFTTLVDPRTIQHTATKTQLSVIALVRPELLKYQESVNVKRFINARVHFPGVIEAQIGYINLLAKRFFAPNVIINFHLDTFVPETDDTVMPFIVLTPESLPIGAGTATTDWNTGTISLHLSKTLEGYERTLTYLGYNQQAYTG